MSKNLGRKLKVLCLHGHHQTATKFREKIGSFRKGLQSHAEFIFLDSIIQEGSDPSLEPSEERQTWFTTTTEKTYKNGRLEPDPLLYDGSFEKSFAHFAKFVDENGPFDGLLTFSQGAAFAHAILGMDNVPKFRFIVFSCGFLAFNAHPKVSKDVIHGLRTFHCINKEDKVIPNELSEELSQCFDDPKPVVHHYDCGHCIPPIKLAKADFAHFFTEIREEIARESDSANVC